MPDAISRFAVPEGSDGGPPAAAPEPPPRSPEAGAREGQLPLWHWRRLPKVLILSLILIFGGSWLGTWIQTGAGAAAVKEVTYLGAGNSLNVAYLYIPDGVTAAHPAPGILAVHGFNNSLVMMSNTSLELARRGYVVLNIDMEDHGLSDFVTPGDGAGGALDGLNYLRSLPIVNKNLVGAIGMSMGGLQIDMAALKEPQDIKALYFMDSGPVADLPIDSAESVGTGTEFAPLSTGWAPVPGVTTAAQLPTSTFLEKFVGTYPKAVVPGTLYGSVSKGTAREYWTHFGDHPFSTDDPASITDAVTWFGLTLGTPTPTSGTIFLWKDFGTGLAGLGLAIFLFAFGGLLLRRRAFADLNESTPEYKGNRGRMWWLFALITTIVGPLLYFWATATGFTDNWFKWEEVSTGFAFWLGMVGLLSIAILVACYFLFARKAGMKLAHYGLTWAHGFDWRKLGKSVLLGLIVGGTAYFILYFVANAMHVDMGVWVLPYQTTNLGHFPLMLAYAIPVGFYFLVTSVVFATNRVQDGQASLVREMVTNMVVLALGIIVMLLIFYIPLEFFGASPPASMSTIGLAQNMMAINGLGLIVLVPTVAALMTYFFRKTGHVYVGTVVATVLVVTFLVGAETMFIA